MNQKSLIVTVPGDGIHFRVSQNGFPADMVLVAQNVADRCRQLGRIPSVHRIIGGMDVKDRAMDMYNYFMNAYGQKLDGAMVTSGATRCGKGEGHSDSVAEVVPFLQRFLPNITTAGSFPRTSGFHLSGQLTPYIGKNQDVVPNPGTEHIVVIQLDGNDDSLDGKWNADLVFYGEYMQLLRDELGFVPVATVWEGGGVSVQEAEMCRALGFWVYVVTGSGRACDNQLAETNFAGKNVMHVPFNQPELQYEHMCSLISR